MNLEKALRNKYRFPSQIGLLTLEQVFELPLIAKKDIGASRLAVADLDGVAREVSRLLKQESEESFVETKVNKVKEQLEDELEIVKHIISVKKAEEEARASAVDKKHKKEQLLAILAEKDSEVLRSKTPEELREMVNAL